MKTVDRDRPIPMSYLREFSDTRIALVKAATQSNKDLHPDSFMLLRSINFARKLCFAKCYSAAEEIYTLITRYRSKVPDFNSRKVKSDLEDLVILLRKTESRESDMPVV